MSKIHLLSDEIINKIAAGEVIEKPANVVKELVENALDANADNITIELREGGKSYIKVSDNGSGMSKEDAMLAIKRHATSKINDAEDLFAINTLGFRGEALASIAAISNLVLLTRENSGEQSSLEDIQGTKLKAEAGKITAVKEAAANPGTTLEVYDLFYNTPARKKYLKSIENELAAIVDVIIRYALANPQISFKLIHNGSILLSSPKTNDTLSNVAHIYGRDAAKQLLPINYVRNEIEILGFISKPSFTKADKSYQSIFVNKRFVKNKVITDALYSGYTTMLMEHRHPVAILNINIDPKKIDVNVHPTKSEIRVNKETELYEAVFEAVKGTFLAALTTELIPKISDKDVKNPYDIKLGDARRKYALESDKQTLLEANTNQVTAADFNADEFISADKIQEVSPQTTATQDNEQSIIIGPIKVDMKLPAMVVLGQLHRTYILAESDSGLLILDQHAVEERVNFEEFLKKSNKQISQPLLKPDLLDLTLKEYLLLKENLSLFLKLGFNLEEFGNNTFVVRAVPVLLGKIYTKEFLKDVINEAANAIKLTDKFIEHKIATKACRASIKAGDNLTLPQMNDLLKRLANCENPFNCPHGRPTIINMTLYEFEKKFKRVV
ncbi:DNA mismatch repair endonuclease MutL [Candidatus Woesearchaeota archaeon]|nr:DNA mismatch repair endonuclease MutL [Candidatus Woesearchaeota archaeon]